jgi:Single-stranded DNA-specific exonuclease
VFNNKSLLGSKWSLKDYDERLTLSFSQKKEISPLLAKLLLIRNIDEDYLSNFLNSKIENQLPNPFILNDMEKSINRVTKAIIENHKIGIIADYDVDGSTSASILYKFLIKFNKNIIIKIPNRLHEGYGPNIRIMDELLNQKVDLIFTLDCGTSAIGIIDDQKYKHIDVIVIDHHLSDSVLPNVFSIINPNKNNKNTEFKQMAAVGVTFIFLMALRKNLRDKAFFKNNNLEPNLLNFLDLNALGTICDVVELTKL